MGGLHNNVKIRIKAKRSINEFHKAKKMKLHKETSNANTGIRGADHSLSRPNSFSYWAGYATRDYDHSSKSQAQPNLIAKYIYPFALNVLYNWVIKLG